MINIAICDDSEQDALNARRVIKQTLNEINIESETIYYLSGTDIEEKLFKHKETLDILILDIDMPDISGLELAEKLRNNNMNLIIIFLSNHEEFVFKAIEFQPFRYIRKIKMEDELPMAIKSAVKVILSNRDRSITIESDFGTMRTPLSHIMYFESRGHKTILHLNNGNNITTKYGLTEFQKNVNSEKFIVVHRTCVVNADYINNIANGMITLDNGEKLIVSRTRFKEIRLQMLKIWGEQI